MVSGLVGQVSAFAAGPSGRVARAASVERLVRVMPSFIADGPACANCAGPGPRNSPPLPLNSGDRIMLQHGKRPTIASRHGMVAAAHPLAAAAGARILSNGGNAFDAAAATATALNVVEPYMSGIAGQGLATCYVARPW